MPRRVYINEEEWEQIPDTREISIPNATAILPGPSLLVSGGAALIREMMTYLLTDRQREVFTLHCFEEQTQIEIAQHLGITQPTVSQHLNGKRRNGKKIGGALLKMRKKTRKMLRQRHLPPDKKRVIVFLMSFCDAY